MHFSFRSVSASGEALHRLGIEAADLNEAYAAARRFAAGIVTTSAGGRDWSGWCIAILDGSGRHQISLPIIEAAGARA